MLGRDVIQLLDIFLGIVDYEEDKDLNIYVKDFKLNLEFIYREVRVNFRIF